MSDLINTDLVQSRSKCGIIHCTVNNTLKVNNIITAIVEELLAIPGIDVRQDVDDRLSLCISQRTISVYVVMQNAGYPRDVRNAVWQAQSMIRPHEHILVTAPALAPGSREWLQQQRISYVDLTGHMFISADGIYVLRDEVSRSKMAAAEWPPRGETNIFRGRATQVLHALLHAPARLWHVTDLAKEADVAPGTALRVCKTLEKMLLMDLEGRGPQSLRQMTEPGKVLDAWSQQHRLSNYEIGRFYRWYADLDGLAREIGTAVEGQGQPYAATLSLGAMHRAPFLTQTDQVALLVSQYIHMPQLLADAKLQRVEDGANVLLLQTKNDAPLMYRQEVDGLRVASDIQLYLDLNASPGRGKEQAEHLRRERMGF